MRAVNILLLLYVAATGGLSDEDATVERDPSLTSGRRVSCEDIAEVWRDLCRQRLCEPREDGGCRKQSASGECSTMRGCVQGNNIDKLKDWFPAATPPTVPEEVEYIRLAGTESQQRYLNLIEPANGHETSHSEGIRVVVHVEIFISPHMLAAMAQGSREEELGQRDAHGEETRQGVFAAGTEIIIAVGADYFPGIVVSVDGAPWLRMPADADDAEGFEHRELEATLLEVSKFSRVLYTVTFI